MAETKTETAAKTAEPKFTKEQLMSSKTYANRKDLLGVLLSDAETYSISEVDKLIDKFMKGKVV